MKQSDAFRDGEASRWLERNLDKIGLDDPVSEILKVNRITPRNALEVGCSNGWRLDRLRTKYGCTVQGIDPLGHPADRPLDDVGFVAGTATDLYLFDSGRFDLVIFGFCLYLVDREDLFTVAAEADRVLADGGHLIIHDFEDTRPFARPYKHLDGILSYHMNYSRLWDWNPAYEEIDCSFPKNDDICILMRKHLHDAWPVRP